MKSFNPEDITDAQLKELFENTRTIAVIGLSPDTGSDSFQAADYLKRVGYRIIPVTVLAHKLLGELCHHELNSIQDPVDIVYFFPHPDEAPQKTADELAGIADQAEKMGIPTLWLHENTRCDNEAKQTADKGLTVIQDAAMPRFHSKVMSGIGAHA